MRLLTEKTDRRENPIALENIQGWSGRFIPTETVFEGEGVAFAPGDILFGKLRPYLAKALLTEFSGEAVGDFFVMRPSQEVNGNFILYQILNKEFISIVDGSTFGAKMPRVSWDFMSGMILAMPPDDEQQTIAAFLDRETAKIDTLIAKQERLIELLGEKRTALISHAVTKGLNPDAPMKESGVEWLGKVPAHWDVVPIRALAQVVRGASPRPAGDLKFFGGNYIPWVTVAEITKNDNLFITDTEDFLTQEGSLYSRIFPAGTLLFSNSGATLGVPKILSMSACANDGVVGFLRLKEQAIIKFLYYYLVSTTQKLRDEIKQGAGQPNLNTDIVKAIRLGLPPIEEQEKIVVEIVRKTSQIDRLLNKSRQTIDLLKERRTALISAAVTGKIDVREVFPSATPE